MNDMYKTLIASGIIGVLISSLINLFISLRSFKEQRNVRALSAKFDFLRDKIKALREMKEKLIEIKTVDHTRIIIQIVSESDDRKERQKLAGEWMTKEFEKHKSRVALFHKDSFFFSKEDRENIRKLIADVDVPEKITDMWMITEPKENEKLSKEKQEEIGIKLLSYRFDLMTRIETKLLNCLERLCRNRSCKTVLP